MSDDLHPRVLLRVVRGGDADAPVEAELADGVVHHLGADHPEVEDVGAAVGRAVHECRRHRRRAQPHVAPDRDRAGLEMLDVCPPDPVCAVLVELRRVDAADVVRLEDLRVEHEAHRSLAPSRDGRAHALPQPPPANLDSMHGAKARDGDVRRPRRLDRARLCQRPGGRAQAGDRLLRPRPRAHRQLRGHGREVRRRRRPRRLRRPDRARGRRRAGRARGRRDRRERQRRASGADRDRGGRGGRRGRRLDLRHG